LGNIFDAILITPLNKFVPYWGRAKLGALRFSAENSSSNNEHNIGQQLLGDL